jgi:hypothetical protein
MRVEYIQKVVYPTWQAGDVGDLRILPNNTARRLMKGGYVRPIPKKPRKKKDDSGRESGRGLSEKQEG